MEADEEDESYILADPALVLLRVPIQGEGADVREGAPGDNDGADDDKVEVMAEIDPDADKEGEVRYGDGRGYVIERFRCLCSHHCMVSQTSLQDAIKSMRAVSGEIRAK